MRKSLLLPSVLLCVATLSPAWNAYSSGGHDKPGEPVSPEFVNELYGNYQPEGFRCLMASELKVTFNHGKVSTEDKVGQRITNVTCQYSCEVYRIEVKSEACKSIGGEVKGACKGGPYPRYIDGGGAPVEVSLSNVSGLEDCKGDSGTRTALQFCSQKFGGFRPFGKRRLKRLQKPDHEVECVPVPK